MTGWTVPGTIVRWVDGDTLIADLDLGWHVRLRQAIRIEGIAAPELSTVLGKTAKLAAERAWPVGTELEVVSRKILGSFDKYGRTLASVMALIGGVKQDVAAAMIVAGDAKPWDGRGAQPT